MYVLPFSMGPIGSPMSQIGVQLTDSPYVVVNMRIMARIGALVFAEIDKDEKRVVPCMHTVGMPLKARGHGRDTATIALVMLGEKFARRLVEPCTTSKVTAQRAGIVLDSATGVSAVAGHRATRKTGRSAKLKMDSPAGGTHSVGCNRAIIKRRIAVHIHGATITG